MTSGPYVLYFLVPHKRGSRKKRLYSARIEPRSAERIKRYISCKDVMVNGIGHFQLAASRRLERFDDRKDSRVKEIEPGLGVWGFWLLRLFLNAQDPLAVF